MFNKLAYTIESKPMRRGPTTRRHRQLHIIIASIYVTSNSLAAVRCKRKANYTTYDKVPLKIYIYIYIIYIRPYKTSYNHRANVALYTGRRLLKPSWAWLG